MRTQNLFYIWALALLALIATSGSAHAAGRGGSNYHFYDLDGCVREPYGVLRNFHIARAKIESDLIAMYENGQRRLRIGIFHGRGLSSGTLIDSTGGTIDQQYLTNLADLLTTIRLIGYEEIQFAFFPQAQNNPTNWSTSFSWGSTQESYLQENWGLVTKVMPVLRASGMFFKVDLGNELYIPRFHPTTLALSNQTAYAKKMWEKFRATYSIGESVGFSVRPSEISALSGARLVYGNYPPYLMSIHVYDNVDSTIRSAHSALNSANYKVTGLVVGEARYNHLSSAQQIQTASLNIGSRPIHYVIQWPLAESETCPNDVNVAPPLEFGNYILYGF